MLIKRGVFERLAGKVPMYIDPEHPRADDGPNVHEFFSVSVDPDTRELLSEDFFFCKLARTHGFKVHAALWAQLEHVGSYVFTGNPLVYR